MLEQLKHQLTLHTPCFNQLKKSQFALNFFTFFRSSLSKVDDLEDTATLIFIGSENEKVLPESQGIAMYKAMRSKKLSPTSLYHYPSEGHSFKTLQAKHHYLMKTITWLHKYWGTFNTECALEPPTTTTVPTTVTDSDGKPITSTEAIAGGTTVFDYVKGSFVMLAMHIFTLCTWYQLKIW